MDLKASVCLELVEGRGKDERSAACDALFPELIWRNTP
jgi:hypothetical protein